MRAYSAQPAAGSDRAGAFTLLERRGYRVPEGATRARLIYLPEYNAQGEVMIVHLEAPSRAVEPNEDAEASSLIARALGDLVLRGARGLPRDAVLCLYLSQSVSPLEDENGQPVFLVRPDDWSPDPR